MSVQEDIDMLANIETQILNQLKDMLLIKGYPPEAVAAVLAKTAYSLYKSILPPTDYQQMAEALYDFRSDIRTFSEYGKAMSRSLN